MGSAEHFKAGRRKPPTPVLRLFRLYRDGKILGPEWQGYRVVKNQLWGPDGRPVSPSHLAHWSLAWQLLAESNNEVYHEVLRRFAQEA